MKNAILVLVSIIGFNVSALPLTNAEYEAKARKAVEFTYEAAVVKGNGWLQQVLGAVSAEAATVEVDTEDSESVWVYLDSRTAECRIEVKLSADFGYTLEPVEFSCPVF